LIKPPFLPKIFIGVAKVLGGLSKVLIGISKILGGVSAQNIGDSHLEDDCHLTCAPKARHGKMVSLVKHMLALHKRSLHTARAEIGQA